MGKWTEHYNISDTKAVSEAELTEAINLLQAELKRRKDQQPLTVTITASREAIKELCAIAQDGAIWAKDPSLFREIHQQIWQALRKS